MRYFIRVAVVLLLAGVCFGQMSHRKLLFGKRQTDSIPFPPTNAALVWWGDMYASFLTNEAGATPPSNNDYIRYWKGRWQTNVTGNDIYLSYYASPKYLATGGPTNGPCLYFGDHVQSIMTTAPVYWNIGSVYTVFWAGRIHTSGQGGTVWSSPFGSNHGNDLRTYTNLGLHSFSWYGNDNGTLIYFHGPTNLSTNVWRVVTTQINDANSFIRVSGTNYFSFDLGGANSVWNNVQFRLGPDNLSLFQCNGDVLEVLVYRGALAISDVQTVEQYLTNKHGISP